MSFTCHDKIPNATRAGRTAEQVRSRCRTATRTDHAAQPSPGAASASAGRRPGERVRVGHRERGQGATAGAIPSTFGLTLMA